MNSNKRETAYTKKSKDLISSDEMKKLQRLIEMQNRIKQKKNAQPPTQIPESRAEEEDDDMDIEDVKDMNVKHKLK
jgi:hypothetical protein